MGKLRTTSQLWFSGIRLYMAIAIVLITLETPWWAFSSYGHTSLSSIRIEEVFAWASVLLLALALTIGPVYRLFPQLPGKLMLGDSRRLFGVGAAWFALLHVCVAYLSLFKAANPLDLTGNYRLAFIVGIIAMLILLAMAVTSFDGAMKYLGVKWFRLHRLVYLAAVAVLLHAFMIGTHAANRWPLITLSVSGGLIVTLQAMAAFRGRRPSRLQIVTMVTVALLLLATLVYGFGQHASHGLLAGKTVR